MINTKLLKKIKKHILAYPKMFMMSAYWQKRRKSKGRPCGSAACIAGWACMLATKGEWKELGYDKPPKPPHDEVNVFTAGQCLLGLDDRQSFRLFGQSYWPREFYEAANKCSEESLEFAKIAAKRIDHFIKTEGKE